jgi:molybdate transport system substrate-binding protein
MRTTMKASLSVFVGVLALSLAEASAHAAELKVLATGSMAEPLKELAEGFTHDTGHTVTFSLGTTGVVMNKLKGGEKADVIVISVEAADSLEKDGRLLTASRADVANSLLGVAVKAGAPSPDISTSDAFKNAVLAARSISYPDPKLGATSGVYIESLFAKLGIAQVAKAKATVKPIGAEVAEVVAKGDIELGLTFLSELVPNKGVKIVGPFPDAIQNPTLYTAGVMSDSANGQIARAFVAFITSPQSAVKLKAAGVAPAAEPH